MDFKKHTTVLLLHQRQFTDHIVVAFHAEILWFWNFGTLHKDQCSASRPHAPPPSGLLLSSGCSFLPSLHTSYWHPMTPTGTAVSPKPWHLQRSCLQRAIESTLMGFSYKKQHLMKTRGKVGFNLNLMQSLWLKILLSLSLSEGQLSPRLAARQPKRSCAFT